MTGQLQQTLAVKCRYRFLPLLPSVFDLKGDKDSKEQCESQKDDALISKNFLNS
jgi:hypothetical protein